MTRFFDTAYLKKSTALIWLLPALLFLLTVRQNWSALQEFEWHPGHVVLGLALFFALTAAVRFLPMALSVLLGIIVFGWDFDRPLVVCAVVSLAIFNTFVLAYLPLAFWKEERLAAIRPFAAILVYLGVLVLKASIFAWAKIWGLFAELLSDGLILAGALWFRRKVLLVWWGRLKWLSRARPSIDQSVALVCFIASLYIVFIAYISGDAAKLYFAFPQWVIDSGSIKIPFAGAAMVQYFPKAYELLISYGMLVSSDLSGRLVAGKAVHALIVGAFISLMISFCRNVLRLSPRESAVALVLLFGCPAFYEYLTRNSPDLLLLPLLLIACAAYFQSLLMLVTVLVLAVLTKYTAIYLAMIFCLFLLLDWLRSPATFQERVVREWREVSPWRVQITFFIGGLLLCTVFFYGEAYVNTGSLFQQGAASGFSHLSNFFPSPYRSWSSLYQFVTMAFVEVSRYTENLNNYGYGLYGFLLIPILFCVTQRARWIFLLPGLYLATLATYTSNTRYFYFMIPLALTSVVYLISSKLSKARGMALACLLLFAVASNVWEHPTSGWPSESALSILGHRKINRERYDVAKLPFSREVNGYLSWPSRTFVQSWDYNFFTRTIPYKSGTLTLHEARQLLDTPGFANMPTYLLQMPGEHFFGGNPFILRCISRDQHLIPFDFMAGQNLLLATIDPERLRALDERLKALGIEDISKFNKATTDAAMENYQASMCSTDDLLRGVFSAANSEGGKRGM